MDNATLPKHHLIPKLRIQQVLLQLALLRNRNLLVGVLRLVQIFDSLHGVALADVLAAEAGVVDLVHAGLGLGARLVFQVGE